MEFLGWCEKMAGVRSISSVQPMHVAAYIKLLARERSVRDRQAATGGYWHLFDWLVVGQVVKANPAASVRGPTHIVKKGKTPVLSPKEARRLLESIDVSTPAGLRDRALISLMVYSASPALVQRWAMKVEDVYVQRKTAPLGAAAREGRQAA